MRVFMRASWAKKNHNLFFRKAQTFPYFLLSLQLNFFVSNPSHISQENNCFKYYSHITPAFVSYLNVP